MSVYFNYRATVANDRWQQRRFLNLWWRFYGRDPFWSPPYFPLLRRFLAPGADEYLDRAEIQRHFVEALRRTAGQAIGNVMAGAIGEKPVAATLALQRPGGANLLALLRCVNNPDALGHLLEQVSSEAPGAQWIAPTHLSPYLGAGVLTSHWSEVPPLHTPYNPPYLPALLETTMQPISEAHLYRLIPDAEGNGVTGPCSLQPLAPTRLAGDLLPLFQMACAPWQPFSPPSAAEAQFVLEWIAPWPLRGWLALVDGEMAGFILVQDDLGHAFWRAGGGRTLPWRLWLRRQAGRAARRGRLLFGAVAPRWRRQGIGSHLLAAALAHGRQRGWEALLVGPIPEAAAAVRFLVSQGGQPRQSYRLYRWAGPAAGWS